MSTSRSHDTPYQLLGLLTEATDRDCSDFGCEGTPSQRCPRRCQADEEIHALLRRVDALTIIPPELAEIRKQARQMVGLEPSDPVTRSLLASIFGNQNIT